ncbi:ABC transporter ATP-binding protein [Paraburkholderia dilworthii]|uniref:ABC transporter ATP-binding protein n=1 Tax=Paraburkholderia dilworthii TaxID=948106 RepID=UPI00042289B2|nr:ABC transporter ATP-binding protein [Paraburkholderia dilworthii]
MSLVEVKSVTRQFRLGQLSVRALDDVSLQIETGAFAALTGPSGSGKTTLLNLIACLDMPDSGSVLIDGTATSQLSESQLDRLRSRSIGMIFQSFNLVPVLNARENVELPLRLHALSVKERWDRVDEALDAVGLLKFAGQRPDSLSGGQRQRVAIARALAVRPRLVLADEPTASLDSGNAFALVDLMRTLNEAHGVTFLFSTHDDRLLGNVRDVIELRDGRITSRNAQSGTRVDRSHPTADLQEVPTCSR